MKGLLQWAAELSFWIVAITVLVQVTGPWLVAGLRALGVGR